MDDQSSIKVDSTSDNALTATRVGAGGVNTAMGADITSRFDDGEIHVWGDERDNVINLAFYDLDGSYRTGRYADDGSPRYGFYKGHHVRGEHKEYDYNLSRDTFNFQGLSEVGQGAFVVGRIEDFDYSRDTLQIEGNTIDVKDGSGTVAGFSWKVVMFDADEDDAAEGDQQWLYIDTGNGGGVFYALEGARVADGGGAGGTQENHFYKGREPDFSSLPAVAYVDPQNHVPIGAEPQPGGRIINDYDDSILYIADPIAGSDYGDVIAAGLNDDKVLAANGNDQVWGGSGNDNLNGQLGSDTLYGGTGDDFLWGGGDNSVDFLYGDSGNDTLSGRGGNDLLLGGSGNDRLQGDDGNDQLSGESGNDTLVGGGGNDRLNGNGGNDRLNGNAGADTFVFHNNFGQDRIADFTASESGERIDLSAVSSITSFNDLMDNHISDTGSGLLIDAGGGNTIILENVDSISDLQSDDFIF